MTRKELLNIKGINDVFTFGKFKGKTILEVLENKPSYIVWCIENIKNFTIDPVLSKELLEQYHDFFNTNNTQAFKNNITKLMDKPYNMTALEALNFLEYDEFEHF